MLCAELAPKVNWPRPESEFDVPNKGELRLPMGVPAFVWLKTFATNRESVSRYGLSSGRADAAAVRVGWAAGVLPPFAGCCAPSFAGAVGACARAGLAVTEPKPKVFATRRFTEK